MKYIKAFYLFFFCLAWFLSLQIYCTRVEAHMESKYLCKELGILVHSRGEKIVIIGIFPHSIADQKKMKKYDVITSFNDRKIHEMCEFKDLCLDFFSRLSDDACAIGFKRNDQDMIISFKKSEIPSIDTLIQYYQYEKKKIDIFFKRPDSNIWKYWGSGYRFADNNEKDTKGSWSLFVSRIKDYFGCTSRKDIHWIYFLRGDAIFGGIFYFTEDDLTKWIDSIYLQPPRSILQILVKNEDIEELYKRSNVVQFNKIVPPIYGELQGYMWAIGIDVDYKVVSDN